jgi:hypothetical protein
MPKSMHLLPIFILTSIGVPATAAADETVVLRAGAVTGSNVVLTFDKEAKPQAIVVRTTQVGVVGSRLEIGIDRAKKLAFSHTFTSAECKFGDGGSKCVVIVPASDPAFARIVRDFRRGRLARVSVQDAGVMKMDQVVPLVGVAKALRGL